LSNLHWNDFADCWRTPYKDLAIDFGRIPKAAAYRKGAAILGMALTLDQHLDGAPVPTSIAGG
jgi:hypothetical protein